MHAWVFGRAYASTEDVPWTNESKERRRVNENGNILETNLSPRGFRHCYVRCATQQHRPTHVVPSTAAWTARETRGPASAQAARKLRLFKHSEIATRAVDDARPEAR